MERVSDDPFCPPTDSSKLSWDIDETTNPTRRFFVRYIVALVSIALMFLLSQAVMQHSFRDQMTDSTEINHAGRQRMLAQRASKSAYALVHSVRLGEDDQARRWANELSDTLKEWRANHDALVAGNKQRGFSAPPPEIQALFSRAYPQLDAIADRCEVILARRRTGAPPEWYTPHVRYIADHERLYLNAMDRVLSAMVNHNHAKMQSTIRLETSLTLVAFCFLALEALLVFEPGRRALALQIERFRDAYHAARESERAKQDFLANMSHEIRTPMNAIVGYADILSEGKGEPDVLDEAVDSLKRNAGHLLQVVNDVLDIAKLNHGVDVVRPHPTVLADVVLDVGALMNDAARKKGLDLSITLANPVPRTLMTDAARLRQILINLVSNAIKYTERGGVEIRINFANDTVSIDVADTGEGIAPDQLERLFDPFTQADTGATRPHGGTGLGLAISRQLAENLGGALRARSTRNVGSVFMLTLPRGVTDDDFMIDQLVRTPTRASEPKEAPSLNELRILLVEDGPDNRKLISYFLEMLGAEVVCTENGQEGVEAAKEAKAAGNDFDLIFMDMQMPVMDGYAAASRLRDLGHATPVIALTAHALEGDRARCIASGCSDYLTKPVTRKRLADTCLRWTGHTDDASRDQSQAAA